jgi:hypothetical protein
MSTLTDLLRHEQVQLWGDLDDALRMASNGYWSVGVENKASRIILIAGEVGITPWEKVNYRLLSSGVYSAVVVRAGFGNPSLPYEILMKPYPPRWNATLEKIATFDIQYM